MKKKIYFIFENIFDKSSIKNIICSLFLILAYLKLELKKEDEWIGSVLLAFLTSNIFYYITVIFPNVKKKNKYSLIIENYLYEVYSNLEAILRLVIDNDKNYELLEEGKFEELEKKHLRRWRDMNNNKYLYIEIEELKEKLKKSIVSLFFYIDYLDISLVSLIEETKRCQMFYALPYIHRLDTVDKIHICDVDDLFKVKKNLKSYCKKNKLIEFIFLHEIYLEKDFVEYKRIALKDLKRRNGNSGNYMMIARLALEIGLKKEYKKYLFSYFKSEGFKKESLYIKCLNFHQVEVENNKILEEEDYLILRSKLLRDVPVEKFYLLPLVKDKELLKDFILYNDLCKEYQEYIKSNKINPIPKVTYYSVG